MNLDTHCYEDGNDLCPSRDTRRQFLRLNRLTETELQRLSCECGKIIE
jgi:hypothetical protein